MKTKISFTSVLKNKNGSRKIDNSSQYGTESQNRSQKLIEIYQQYLSYPDKPYIIDLNAFGNMAHRSRNSSIGMVRSRNAAHEDPQVDLQSWIQNQKVRQVQARSKNIYTKKCFKTALNSQNQMMPSRKSKSNFKRLSNQPQYQYYDQQNQGINCSNGYSQKSMQESSKASSKHLRKHQLNFRSQPQQRYTQQRQMEQSEARDGLVIQSTKKSPQQLISLAAMKSRNQYPGIEEQDYSKLQEEFEKVKAQKISQLCMQSKRSLNKQKMQEIIKKTLQNIHEDIQKMAEQIVQQKRKTLTNQLNKKKISEQQSQQMLISGSRYQQKQDLSQSEQQMRQQNMRNMIKGYINGIQQAKSQGKGAYNYQDKYQQRQDENNFYQNTFNNQVFQNQPSFSNNNKGQINGPYSSNEPMDSVGYSFSNNNMICQHSFNKEINPHSNFQGPQNSFQKNPIQPPIYEPENQDQDEQQKISLPYIEEVRSDCGDFPHQNHQVQSSQEIEFKRKKVQNLMIDISGKNIKNIQSVHYEPPAEQIGQINEDKYYRNQRNNQQLFKNFEESYPSNRLNDVKRVTSPTSSSQNTSVQAPKFISKTFNSYLSGQKRFEYGQTVNAKQSYHEQEKSSDSNYSSTFQNSRKIIAINPPLSTGSAQSSIKIGPITKFSPQRQYDNLQTKNSQYEERQQSTTFATLQPTKKPSFQQSKFQSNYSKQSMNVLKFSKNHSNQIQKQQNYHNVTSSKGLNESSMMSMNQSINNNSLAHITSPKNVHQLQSKQKFSINSPITKVGEQISLHNFDKNTKQSSSVTEFYTQKPIIIHNRSSSYAISSPIEEYRINQSFQQTVTIQNSHQRIQSQYACSESIVQKPIVIKNSILQMQPLKLSIPNSSTSLNQFEQKRISEQTKIQYEKTIQQNNLNKNYPGVQRIAQSRQDNAFSYEQDKTQAIFGNNHPTNMSSGRNFLQSLNTKQSIEIDLPSSSNSKSKQISEQKQSFATQTFRPTNYVSQNQGPAAKPSFSIQKSTPTNKLSVTKITLKSSSDKNPMHSPKVISLTVNHINQAKHDTIKPFSSSQPNEQKQNVFERLTIKQSINANQISSQKRNLLPLNYQSTSSNGQSSTFNIKQQNLNLQQSIKTCFGGHKIHNHVDLQSKQNNNTMNQSRQNLNKQSKGNKDWKNDSMNFDLNLDNPTNSMKQSISTTNKASLLQKKQPLLKLSKNLNSSINQQTYNNNVNFGVKKSIGQSIKFKPNQPSTMISSKMNSIRNSFKTGVKQSIGNDSDMDFDLQLD